MAGGKVQHWKHGWIPISPEAKAYVAGRGPKGTNRRKPLDIRSLHLSNSAIEEDSLEPSERVRSVEATHGTWSKEHIAAIRKWGDEEQKARLEKYLETIRTLRSGGQKQGGSAVYRNLA